MNSVFKLLTISIIIAESTAKSESESRSHDCELDGNKHLDLCGSLRKSFFVHGVHSKPYESAVCSPISALMPLGKLTLGADGGTLQELLDAVGVSKKSMISNQFKRLILELRYLPGVRLDIASKLYVSSKSHLQRAFADQARDIFESSITKIDFQYPTYTAEEINTWVSSQTNGRIQNIISPDDITPTTSLILVNAVYFNAKWETPFKNVKNGTFHTLSGKKTIPMMKRVGPYNYTKSEALGAELVKIPFKEGMVTFLLVLPISNTGLLVLLNQLKLAPDILEAAISQMEERNVDLTIPKFKIETDLNLKEVYEKIGVKGIFNEQDSGLTNIIRGGTISVSSAKHKAFIEVNEYGTEAAASSGIGFTTLSQVTFSNVHHVKADHPFLFFILVRGQQLFAGTLVNPK
ncbi:unnamed protein product [Euphydryas editha]|uniref:Serpin domain-containing protein n=1 Tax=Euphydryas editha TaxID=104508 RepID=A0AAU9VDV7_EUPED|nr:unnamed protein product [Euphydryas editha]